ncbi:hypothetical protein Pan153_12590 [Gimesia panareensis]|uniref:Uncharacterized protein n=1 Tax=Gimesia panareensis TaxID=2527978 RepID=A0A518FJT9_9PLAN|nr:hypothetical protein [Gimesia panareensis]QDV16628.1 hypothetical protein Pan153_12590 [Gimesia panareensis]
MSNAELLVELEAEEQHVEQSSERTRELEIDHRSQEMLLVLNEVFDSIVPSSKS